MKRFIKKLLERKEIIKVKAGNVRLRQKIVIEDVNGRET